MDAPVMQYETIRVGREFPAVSYELTSNTIMQYQEAVENNDPRFLEPREGKLMAPPTTAAIYVLEAFRVVFANRPPGNIHAKQKFIFHEPAYAGDILETILKIVDKYVKKDKQYLVIESSTRNQHGRLIVTGLMTMIWGG